MFPMLNILLVALLVPSVLGSTQLPLARLSAEDDSIVDADLASDDYDVFYELVQHKAFSRYSLRVTEPDSSVCDATVKQHTGFLDISDGKHLFFWFFESRKTPDKAPLTLWLNGGPGGSSTLGLFQELGPCLIQPNGTGTRYNPYSWNTYSNIIFLDQPVNVGYSYSTDGSKVDNTPVAAEDVYAFLQLFLSKFPEYSSAPFHVAAESYGGTYGPHVAAEIHKRNKALAETPDAKKINLASVILANGHTDPKIQLPSTPDYLCDSPYALLKPGDPTCASLREKIPTCQRLIQTCYDFDTPLTCAPATAYCENAMWDPIISLGVNPYDTRRSCGSSPTECYPEFGWIATYLNKTSTKKAIGLDPATPFTLINFEMNLAFHKRGDSARNSAALLPELISDGVRLLVYAGVMDLACNYLGNERWVTQLDNVFHDEFVNTTALPWVIIESGTEAGAVRFAGGHGETAGNLTFVRVYESGHMVPYDQPEAALDLFARWIFDLPWQLDGSTLNELAH